MKMKRSAAALLAAVLSAGTILSACAGNSSQRKELPDAEAGYELDSATPAWKIDRERSSALTWYVNADWWNTGWGDDTVTGKIADDMNLTVEFLTGDDEKLNTYFAGGELPDVITVLDANSSVVKSAPQWAFSLDDLSGQYDPHFMQVASEDTLNWYKKDDGKTYGYPNYSNSQKDYDEGYIKASTAFAIRQDVYTAIGEPSLGTPAEFLDAMRKIKEKFPELIPFGFNSMLDSTGSLEADLQNFLGVPIEEKDGGFYNRNLDPDYLNWIRTFSEAYRNGYISDDSFADDGTTHEEKVKAGKYASIFIGGTPQRSGPLQIFMNENPESKYIAIDGPQSTTGNSIALSQSGLSGWMINFISKDCKDPAKAIQLFTYLLSDEGQILVNFGIEGETFEVNDDGLYQLLPEVVEMKLTDNDRYKKEYRLSEFILFGHDRYQTMSTERSESIRQMQEWGEGKLKTQFVIENIDPDQGTSEARSLSAINTKWLTTLVALIRSGNDSEFDRILNEYQDFLNDNNWDKIVSVRTGKMQENRSKLGLQPLD